MRWSARVGDRLHQVELAPKQGEILAASVDGRAYTLSLTEPQPSVYSILAGGVSHEAIVQVRDGRCRVRIGGRRFEVVPEDPQRGETRRSGDPEGKGGRATVRAVMPGRIVRVMVAAGQRVAAGAGLLVVEAMKMENEISAPREGVVKQVGVEPGGTVETGDVLVVIE